METLKHTVDHRYPVPRGHSYDEYMREYSENRIMSIVAEILPSNSKYIKHFLECTWSVNDSYEPFVYEATYRTTRQVVEQGDLFINLTVYFEEMGDAYVKKIVEEQRVSSVVNTSSGLSFTRPVSPVRVPHTTPENIPIRHFHVSGVISNDFLPYTASTGNVPQSGSFYDFYRYVE